MAAPSSGARLTDLRELLQLTQKELSAKSGIAQSAISAVEKGQRELSPTMVATICAAVRIPMPFFATPSTPTDPAAVHFRKTAGVSAKSTKAALRYFEEMQRITDALMETLPSPGQGLQPVEERVVCDGIEAVAAATRVELGIHPAGPIKHVMRALERSGVAVAPLVRLGDDHPAFDGHSGMSRATDRSSLVMYAPATAGDRQRFTLAHEIGHLKLHRADTGIDGATRENEAHRFAGAFLYPRDVAADDISESLSLNGYARIKARWGISIQALIRRGRDLRLISPERHRSLMIQVSSRGWRKDEPVRVGVEMPLLLWRMLSTAYGPTPYMAASHDFGISPEFLELWIPNRVGQRQGTGGSVVPLFAKS